ncbi:MAG TPA: GDSL-type esterase/lipase family protein, partial [Micavibrio sp.]|nr:GDSL-type esterase/lipase family protein [Micavibrio sp.]
MRLFLLFALLAIASNPALAQTKRIVALGDSLTAGYGLQSGEDFASKLQESLIREGLDVRIDNAGISGDTTAGGLARLDRAIEGEQRPDLVLVALGANDMLRGIDTAITK